MTYKMEIFENFLDPGEVSLYLVVTITSNTLFGATVSLIESEKKFSLMLLMIYNYLSPSLELSHTGQRILKKLQPLLTFTLQKASGSLELLSDHSAVVVTLSKTLSTSSLNCHLNSRRTNWAHLKPKVPIHLQQNFRFFRYFPKYLKSFFSIALHQL